LRKCTINTYKVYSGQGGQREKIKQLGMTFRV
jgi:hypothetical protein